MISKIIGDIAELLSGIVDIIEGLVTGDFRKIQEGFSEITSALIDFLEYASQAVYGIMLAAL